MNKNLIKHLALIMDGNKRWSIQNSTSKKDAYIAGLNNLLKISKYCISANIRYLSVYALSSENLFRPDIKTIFDIIKDKSNEVNKKLLLDKEIKINFIGEINKLPIKTLSILNDLESSSKKNHLLDLNIIINYNPFDELKYMINKVILEKNNLEITNDIIKKNMYLSNTPNPDLLIRTGGYQRLSNFLLLYLGYTELFFTSTLWPDLDINELDIIFEKFKKTRRNYGL